MVYIMMIFIDECEGRGKGRRGRGGGGGGGEVGMRLNMLQNICTAI
jgi:hypothetical protein